jgi:hypothetical protein
VPPQAAGRGEVCPGRTISTGVNVRSPYAGDFCSARTMHPLRRVRGPLHRSRLPPGTGPGRRRRRGGLLALRPLRRRLPRLTPFLHSEYPLEDCPPLDPTRLPSAEALEWALRARRSARVFRDRPVPREVVRELVDAGRWAPSASNAQPVDWLAIDDPARIAALSAQTVASWPRRCACCATPWSASCCA